MNSSQWLIRSANNDSGRTTMVNCAVEAISTPLKPRLLLDLVYYWIPFIVRRGKMRIEKTRQTASSSHQLAVTVLRVIGLGRLQPAGLAETWR